MRNIKELDKIQYNFNISGYYLQRCLLFKTQRLGDWILSPCSSDRTHVGSTERATLSS
jgi:hypothetical protein